MTPAKELSSGHRNGKSLELPAGTVTVTALWSSGPTSHSAMPPPPARSTADSWAVGPLRVGSRGPRRRCAARICKDPEAAAARRAGRRPACEVHPGWRPGKRPRE